MSIDTIKTTIANLEGYWGNSRGEWELLGPTDMAGNETVRFSRRSDGWALERHNGDTWYVASDDRFDSEDVPGGELSDAIATHDVDAIASVLDDTPVDYTVDRSVPAYPQLEVPGWGKVYWDDQVKGNHGWVVGALDDGWQDAIEPNELLDSLLDVIGMAQKVA